MATHSPNGTTLKTRHIYNHGFTLIELLVSLAIVGVLAVLAVANYKEFRSHARDVKRINLNTIVLTALEAYHVDNNAYPPNPHMGSACSTDEPACLQEIEPFIVEAKLRENLGGPDWRTQLLFYYNYILQYDNGWPVVVKVQLERTTTNSKNPCYFNWGSWCDNGVPLFSTSYCKCVGSMQDPRIYTN